MNNHSGVAQIILQEVDQRGSIQSLMAFANEQELDYSYTYHVARKLEKQGLLTIQIDKSIQFHPMIIKAKKGRVWTRIKQCGFSSDGAAVGRCCQSSLAPSSLPPIAGAGSTDGSND